jgi:hypothetical protein
LEYNDGGLEMLLKGKALAVFVIATVVFITGCFVLEQAKGPAVTRKAVRLNKNVHVPAIYVGPRPLEAGIATLAESGRTVVPPPEFIPGRLLVKINANQTRSSYYRNRSSALDIREIALLYRKLPADLHITKLVELGKGKNGKWQFVIHMEKPRSQKGIQELLKGTPFSLVPDKLIRPSMGMPTGLVSGGGITTIVVETDEPGLDGIVDTIPRYKYPQLKPESKLNETFNELNVLSIRRVFRMAEVENRSGLINVHSMNSLLAATKQKYQVRASRGYKDVDIPPNMENWFLLRLGSKVKISDVYKVLESNSHIESISYDFPVKPHGEPYEEPRFPQQAELGPASSFGIEIEPAWAVTATNNSVIVAVIGSGIQTNLDEFTGRLWVNSDEAIDGGDTDNNGYVNDVDGITTDDSAFELNTSGTFAPSSDHETKVAAIIAADGTNDSHITGVMGKVDVQLMNIKLGHGNWGACVEVAEAIMYATVNGADIVNMSFGVAPSPVLSEAIDAAVTDQGGGVTLIASAGNRKIRATQDYHAHGASSPSCYRHVIAVGGSDLNGHLWQSATDPTVGSNYGVHIDVVAPSKNVQTITYTSLGQVVPDATTMTGTSASAAMVSGVSALLLGKYPTTRVERMRLWLRANATDLTDPMNDGSNLTGDDIYTGAGLVNAELAITQGEPDPILVEVRVERISNWWSMNASMRNLVAGSPNIGIQVQGPLVDPTGVGPGRWRLDYGLGDDPSTWFPLVLSDAVSTDNNVTYTVTSYGSHVEYTNSVNIGNPLDTDLLANEQVYTIHLQAKDAAGREYNAYDWFMPVRALLTHPAENQPVTTRWGWPQIDGFADTRSGATYNLRIIKDGVVNSNWMLTNQTHLYEGPSRSTNLGALVVPEHTGGGIYFSSNNIDITDYPMFAAGPSGEGPATIELMSRSPSGALTVDVHNIYLDNSSFPLRPGPPIEIPYVFYRSIWGNKGIVATEVDAAGTYMIFIQYTWRFIALDLNGNLVWEISGVESLRTGQDFTEEDALNGPVFVVDDLDGDGNKEVAVSGYRCVQASCGPDGQGYQVEVHVRKAIDGTPLNANWDTPLSYVYYDRNTPKKLHAGDLDGDGNKELIFYQPAVRSGDHVPETEVPAAERGYGKLHVIDVTTAQPLPYNAFWPKQLPLMNAELEVGRLSNTNPNNKILVAQTLEAFDQSGNLAAWSAEGDALKAHARMIQIDGSTLGQEVVTYGRRYDYGSAQHVYWMDLFNNTGTRLPGNWPVDVISMPYDYGVTMFDYELRMYVQAADIVSGGSKELLIAAGDKLRALNIDGSPVAGFPDIDLGGSPQGLKVLNIDGDTVDEIVVLVLHIDERRAYLAPGYFNLNAYEMDGTPLATTDNRWPIRIASTPSWGGAKVLGKTVEVVDADGDGKPEVVDLIGDLPYERHGGRIYYGREGRIDILDLP